MGPAKAQELVVVTVQEMGPEKAQELGLVMVPW